MASKTSKLLLVFSTAVVLQLVASAVAEECVAGQAFPKDTLPGCRAYVLRRCRARGRDVDVDDPLAGVRARCCQQLREVATVACRCEALQRMLDVLAVEAEQQAAASGCRKGDMAGIAGNLPGRSVCDVQTPHAYAGDHYCPLRVSN